MSGSTVQLESRDMPWRGCVPSSSRSCCERRLRSQQSGPRAARRCTARWHDVQPLLSQPEVLVAAVAPSSSLELQLCGVGCESS
jgi:hypothetical protein